MTRHTNADIGRIIRMITIYLDMEGVPFKPPLYGIAVAAVSLTAVSAWSGEISFPCPST